jgi:hypothetical protein
MRAKSSGAHARRIPVSEGYITEGSHREPLTLPREPRDRRWATSRTSIAPSGSRQTLKRTDAVFLVGVDLHVVGGHNGARWRLSRGTLILKGAENGWRSWTRPGDEGAPEARLRGGGRDGTRRTSAQQERDRAGVLGRGCGLSPSRRRRLTRCYVAAAGSVL